MSNNEVTRPEYDPEDVVMLDVDDEVDDDPSPDYNADDDSETDDDDDSEEEQEPRARPRPATQRQPRPPPPRIIAPWGENVMAGGRHRTYYPPYFPRIIRRLISLIPYQEGPIGQNIRPVVVDLVRAAFSPTTLGEIASLLSLAPPYLLRDIGLEIAEVVRACWEGPEDASILVSNLVAQHVMVSVRNWVGLLRDHQFPGRMAGVFTGPALEHLIIEHTFVISRPSDGARMALVAESCPQGLAPTAFSLTDEIQNYLTSLPVVSAEEIAADDTCHICMEKYGSSTGTNRPEQPLKLPCNHVFGNECLTQLLVSDNQEAYRHSACPLCRAPIEVFDFEDADVWIRVD
ncbi:MAG: hypothetical protein Q9195_006492 [Heterodermia aff. obscurata]